MKKLIAFLILSFAAFSSFAQTQINPAKLLKGQSGGAPMFLKTDAAGNVSWSNYNDIINTLAYSPTKTAIRPKDDNTILPNAIEASVIMNGDTLEMFYHDLSTTNHDIRYKYATNAKCDNFVEGDGGIALNVSNSTLNGSDGKTAKFPYVFKDPATNVYYLVAGLNTVNYAVDGGNMWLWKSTNKTTWTLAKNSPILTHSATTTDWNYQIFNPAMIKVGSRWHLLIEGMSANVFNFKTGYSYSDAATPDLIDFNANLTSVPVLPTNNLLTNQTNFDSGNPFLIHVPDRNALIAIFGDYSSGKWQLQAATVSLSSNLSLPSSWKKAPGFGVYTQGIDLADPTVCFNNNATKDFKMLMVYNYDQIDNKILYGQLGLNEFYDYITNPLSKAADLNLIGKIEVDGVVLGHNGGTVLSSNFKNDLVVKTGDSPTRLDSLSLDGKGTFTKTDAATNAVTNIINVKHITSSGTTSNGIGIGIGFQAYNSAYSSIVEYGNVTALVTDQIGVNSDFIIKSMRGNVLTEQARFISNGTLKLSSFGIGLSTDEILTTDNVTKIVKSQTVENLIPMLKLTGRTYSNPSTETAYRLNLMDYGGVANDAGIGLDGSSGNDVIWMNAINGQKFYAGGTLRGTIDNVGLNIVGSGAFSGNLSANIGNFTTTNNINNTSTSYNRVYNGSGTGYVMMNVGDETYSGYFQYFRPNGQRALYSGYASNTGPILNIAENGAWHKFGGGKLESTVYTESPYFVANVPNGTQPYATSSNTLNVNLNANYIRGLDSNVLAQRNTVNAFTENATFAKKVGIGGAADASYALKVTGSIDATVGINTQTLVANSLTLTGASLNTSNTEVLSIASNVVSRQNVKDLEIATYVPITLASQTTDVGGGVLKHTLTLDCGGYFIRTFKVNMTNNSATAGTQITFTNMKAGGDYTVVYYSNTVMPLQYDSSAKLEDGSTNFSVISQAGAFTHRFRGISTSAVMKAF